MSIRIEIEGSSIEEVADKLLALGSKLAGVSTVAIAAAQVEAPGEPEKPKRTRPTKAAPIADAPSPDAAEASQPVTESSKPETPSATSEQPSSGEPTAPSDAAPLDFDKDVTPAVLGAVEKHGREKVSEVLDTFGVARASQLDEARWSELMQSLADLG